MLAGVLGIYAAPKCFHCEPGKDLVVIVRGNRSKRLSSKSKLACHDCGALISELHHFGWDRRVRAFAVSYPLRMWDNLLQEFHLFGEQAKPSNSCDAPSSST